MRSDSLRPLAALVLGALVGGCATPSAPGPSAGKEAWSSSAPTAPRRFDPNAFAAQFIRPADCEHAARDLQATSREAAWAGLKACINKGNFLTLRLLANPAWAHDLQTRPEAPELLTRMIAARGGAIASDLELLHELQVPLFTLNDGVSEPDLYKGRYVLFRAKVGEMRSDGSTFTAKLDETALKSEPFDYQVGLAHRTSTETRVGGNIRGHVGPFSGGSVGGNVSVSNDKVSMHTGRKYDNVVVETGREALVRMPEANPFLEPGKEFIVLARFDGVRATSSNAEEDEPEVVPVLTLVSFHPPSPLVIY